MIIKPKVGVLVTALLEDDYNKTAHMRPLAQKAADRIGAIIGQYADAVCPPLVEEEHLLLPRLVPEVFRQVADPGLVDVADALEPAQAVRVALQLLFDGPLDLEERIREAERVAHRLPLPRRVAFAHDLTEVIVNHVIQHGRRLTIGRC